MDMLDTSVTTQKQISSDNDSKSNSGALSCVAVAIALALGGASMNAHARAVSTQSIDTLPSVYSPLHNLVSARVARQSSSAPTGPDSDGDGIRNQDDLDDDNDGILDRDEGLVDADGDGFPDGDSIDTDNDGTPDVVDLDSDNDGILDLVEARADAMAALALDPNSNGAISVELEVGSNGITDVIETFNESGELIFELADTDNDGVPDFRDLDSDNDEIYDVIEAGGVDTDFDGRIDGFNDTDGKGVADSIQASALPLFDTDGDGQLDFRDLDSDGDTIPDIVEAGGNRSQPRDTDGDGAADYRETDSDGDGVSDQIEAGSDTSSPADTDGDGVADFQDPDVVNDGASDGSGGSDGGAGDGSNDGSGADDDDRPDRDGDGIANQDDLDDDNDGILDTEEGIIDADGNGVADASSRDTDGDGTPDGNDLDSDNDGILDIFESRFDQATIDRLDTNLNGAIDVSLFVGSNGLEDSIETSPDSGEPVSALFDTDGDGTPDYLDIDSDNDGISDLVEAGGSDADNDGRIDNFEDRDDKGVDDGVQASALPLFDTDGDGVRDFQDSDSDNDGLPDSVEGAGDLRPPTDSDGDGAADFREQDSDNDGISDTEEAGSNPESPVDTDGNGVPDFQQPAVGQGPDVPDSGDDNDGDGQNNGEDNDDDNDGISDAIEGNGDADNDGIVNSMDRDSDNDGVLDALEGSVDSDGDGVPDFLDLDSDNDGIYDALEASRGAISSSGRLATGAADSAGLVSGANDQIVDTDGDGVPDRLDLDSDNDGLTDVAESLGVDQNLDARLDITSDNNADGAEDSLTSLPLTLLDLDMDRVPNVRDLDTDQDGLSDILENYGQLSDLDGDGRVDNFADSNGDGLDDSFAAGLVALLDTDADGLPNAQDLDSDDDGVSDLVESGGVDSDNNGINDAMTDSDGDGIPDVSDSDSTNGVDADGDSIDDSVDADFVSGSDSDGDGIVDAGDPDSNGDGFNGPNADGTAPGQGSTQPLPDSNTDGVPDIIDSSLSDDVAPRSGVIETGLGGTGLGCSVNTLPTLSSAKRVDPMLGLLLGGSMLLLGVRRGLFGSLKKKWISLKD